MEPIVKRSWIIDSVVIILLALAMPFLRTHHIDRYLFQFPIVTFLIFYFIGKAVQRFNDKKEMEEQRKMVQEAQAAGSHKQSKESESDSKTNDLPKEDN